MKSIPLLLSQLALGLCLFACSAPKLHKTNRDLLVQGVERLERGQFEGAVQFSDKLVFATAEKPRDYQLQRFFAAFLAAQAHMSASFSGSFLKDPKEKRSMGIGGQEDESGSVLAHMVAAGRSSGYGLDWFPASAPESGLEALLPEGLAKLGAANARDNLNLGLMTIYTRLGFDNKIASSLSNSPELLNLETCQAMLERTQFLPAARPWVMYMVFHHLRDSNEPMAFSFAAEALFQGLSPAVEKEMQVWISEESNFRFTCPEGQHPADPTVKRCNDDVLLKNFICERKT